MDESLTLLAEEKLPFLLCRLEFSDRQKSEVSALVKAVKDWDYFLDLSNKHGIVALAWYNLTMTDNDKYIPSTCLSKLRSSYLTTLSRNTYLYSCLADILRLVKMEEIKVVLLKGLALEKTLYGNKGLRQMSDMDLLVSQNDVMRFRKILIGNGFRPLPLKSRLYGRLILFYGKHIPALIKDDCSVDIHFRLFESARNFLTEKLIETSRPFDPGDQKVYIPSPLFLFLYLVGHLAYHEKHGGVQLRMFTDLFLLINSHRDDIICKQLIDYAEASNLQSQVASRLFLLEIFWGIEYPVWMNNFINQFDHSGSREKFILFLKNPKNEPGENRHVDFINQLKEMPGFPRKALYVTGFIFPSLSFMKERYKTNSRIVAIIYYPVRWFETLRLLARLWFKG